MAAGTLRQRRRRQSMAEIQAAAIALFETRGFDAVTVEDVASVSGVSPSTVYRYFGTKEALVIHDQQDAVLTAELEALLGHRNAPPPGEAFRDAAITALAGRGDADLFRRQVRLIFATPALWAAAVEQDHHDRLALAAGFAQAGGRPTAEIADEVLAASCLAALDVALDHWQQDDDASLVDLLHAAFAAALRNLPPWRPAD